MAQPHRKSDETPAWWMKQIEQAKKVYKEAQKLHFRRQLHGCLDLVLPLVVGPLAQDETELGAIEAPETIQIDINYIQRYVRWVEAQTFDQHPEILYPRFASPDTQTGEMIAELLKRVGDEAREMEEWRLTIADAAAMGVFAVWYGVGNEVMDEEGLHYMMMPQQDIIEMAREGVHQAHPGQDHAKMERVFLNLAWGDPQDPESVEEAQARYLEPGGEQLRENFVQAAENHRRQRWVEAQRPQPIRFAESEVWCQRRPVGESTLWDAEADNIRDARWVARRFAEDVDSVRKNEAYKPSVRRRVEAGNWQNREGFFRKTDRSRSTDSTKAAIWEIWDRKYRERHYIVEDTSFTSFLEANPKNPYTDDLGRPLLKDFFPVVIEAPIKAPTLEPTTPYGIPVAAPAWPLQKAAIQFLSHNMDAVKKLATAMWDYPENIDQEDLENLQSGEMGKGVKRPEGVEAGKMVGVVDFGSVDRSVFEQFLICEQKVALLLAWPISQMTGQPVANTATAEQISVTAGHEQLGDFIRTMENAYARGQEIKRALIKRFYSDEKVEELVGPEFVRPKTDPETGQEVPALWPIWRVSSLKGDRLTAIFKPRLEGQTLARKKQVGDVLTMAMSLIDPFTQLPLVKPSEIVRLFNELVNLHGLGKVEMVDYQSKEMEPMLMAAMQAKASGGSSNGKAPTGSGGHRKDSDKERSKKPASDQQEYASAAKAGPSGGAGRGMAPI